MDSIALCLSGGGLRASYFHFGVVCLLRDAKLLKKVSHIYSVSGGSILAAHLVANWEDYTGSDEQFARVKAEFLALAKRDIRGNALRRWLLSYPLDIFLPSFGLTAFLEKEYADFLNHRALVDLSGPEESPRPELHLLTTSLTTGELCSFSHLGLHLWGPDRDEEPLRGGAIPLAKAVAASSAFPPLFPPVVINTNMLSGVRPGKLPREPEYLTDGGVYDNLGSQLATRLRRERSLDVDSIMISDAGATFNWDIRRENWWILPRNIRSTNILMKCVTDMTTSDSIKSKWPVFSISDLLPDDVVGALPGDLQPLMSRIRTDLDDFSRIEVLLARHGYDVARHNLEENGGFKGNLRLVPPSEHADEEWSGKKVQDYSKMLQAAQYLRITIINLKDKAFYALLAKAALIAFLLVYVPFDVHRTSILREVTQPTETAGPNDVVISNVPKTVNPENLTVSKLSTNIVQRVFINQASQPVTLYWVDFSGKEISYGSIAPNARISMTTYVGHLWVAKSPDGRVLLTYAATS
jgi:predicted acylesterase/phospholipase RssA